MTKNYLLAVIAAVALVGCEKDTTVELPPHTPKLVVHGQQPQGRLFNVRVSRSIAIGATITQDPNQFIITTATVLLKQNSIVVDTLRYNTTNRRYEGKVVRSVTGNTYSVQVLAAGFNDAEGTSYLPNLVRPEKVQLKKRVRVDEWGDYLDEIVIEFNDDPAVVNYYLLRIRHADGRYAYCVLSNDKDVERLVYSEPFYTDECLEGDRLLLSDKNFNGSRKTIVFHVNTSEMDELIQQNRTVRPTIELLNITFDFYKYIKSLNAYENSEDNPFAEPVNLLSNIKNGYGFFTAYAMAVDTLR